MIVMQAHDMGDGAGPQTRRLVTLNVVASQGALGSRARGGRVGVDAATESARAVAEPAGKHAGNHRASQSTPSRQPRRAPPVPRFEASADASKTTSRAYDLHENWQIGKH